MSTKTNGTAKNPTQTGNTPTPELSNLSVSAPKENGKPAQEQTAPGTKPEPTPQKMPSIQERLAKLQDLKDAEERREDLVDALNKVKKFDFKTSNATPRLKFDDGNGNTFSIPNLEAIGECVKIVTGRLEAEIAAVEAEISFFC